MPPTSQHLLLVEDECAWRDRLGEVARAEGFAVSVASDGREALDWLKRHPRAGHPDLILLDLLLPEMDGWELYGRLRTDTRLQHLNVLMMSAALSGEELPLGGVVGYLRKPASPDALVGELRARLRQLSERPRPSPAEAYALHLPEEARLALEGLGAPVRHTVRMHLLRAAELAATELPMASTWLMALPGDPPSLLVSVAGLRVVLEVDDEGRALHATSVIIPPYLRCAS